MSIMAGLQTETTGKYLFDAQAGLSGTDLVHRYPCIHDELSNKFFVWLGDTDFAIFTKSTFMNLSNFGESVGAISITFLIYR